MRSWVRRCYIKETIPLSLEVQSGPPCFLNSVSWRGKEPREVWLNPLLVPDLVNSLCLKVYMHYTNPLCYLASVKFDHKATLQCVSMLLLSQSAYQPICSNKGLLLICRSNPWRCPCCARRAQKALGLLTVYGMRWVTLGHICIQVLVCSKLSLTWTSFLIWPALWLGGGCVAQISPWLFVFCLSWIQDTAIMTRHPSGLPLVICLGQMLCSSRQLGRVHHHKHSQNAEVMPCVRPCSGSVTIALLWNRGAAVQTAAAS